VTDTEALRSLFDELASDYDQHLRFFAAFGNELVSRCALRRGQQVLDVGAGRGAITMPAAHDVGDLGRVVAIDNAGGMLSALTRDCRELPQVELRFMDAHRLEFETSSFDAVTYGFVLHFLDDPEQAIAEAHRVLRPGGRLAFSGPPTGAAEDRNRDPRWDFYAELMAEMARRSAASNRRVLFSEPARPLPTLCDEAGFTNIEQRRTSTRFTFRDPEHYWTWSMSHGFRGFVDSLGDDVAAEFRARMLKGLHRMHAGGGISVEPDVVITTAIKR
jgi:ubiquinone/menaquinone biosynthesis C-methylase UbiE